MTSAFVCAFSMAQNVSKYVLQDCYSLMKAQEEIDRVLQGRSASFEDIKDLKFLTRCINESMRLYPHPPVGCSPCLSTWLIFILMGTSNRE